MADGLEIWSRIRDGVVSYWRTPSGTEVDFVVGTTAIEVKSARMIGRSDCSGLRSIADEGTFAHRIVVCREPMARVADGIEILPFADFIARLWSDALIDLDSVAVG